MPDRLRTVLAPDFRVFKGHPIVARVRRRGFTDVESGHVTDATPSSLRLQHGVALTRPELVGIGFTTPLFDDTNLRQFGKAGTCVQLILMSGFYYPCALVVSGGIFNLDLQVASGRILTIRCHDVFDIRVAA